MGDKFGTPAYKLHRSTDTSREAAEGLNTTLLEEKVYKAVKTFGRKGCIQDQILQMFPGANLGKNYGSLTGRFAALLEKKYIFDTQERRIGSAGRGQRVLVAKEFLLGSDRDMFFRAYMDKRKSLSKREIKAIENCINIIRLSSGTGQSIMKIKSFYSL